MFISDARPARKGIDRPPGHRRRPVPGHVPPLRRPPAGGETWTRGPGPSSPGPPSPARRTPTGRVRAGPGLHAFRHEGRVPRPVGEGLGSLRPAPRLPHRRRPRRGGIELLPARRRPSHRRPGRRPRRPGLADARAGARRLRPEGDLQLRTGRAFKPRFRVRWLPRGAGSTSFGTRSARAWRRGTSRLSASSTWPAMPGWKRRSGTSTWGRLLPGPQSGRWTWSRHHGCHQALRRGTNRSRTKQLTIDPTGIRTKKHRTRQPRGGARQFAPMPHES